MIVEPDASRIRMPIARLAGALAAIAGLCIAGAAHGQYLNRVMTDNICCEEAHFDPHLARAWGVQFDPTGFAWLAAHFSGRADLLDGEGNPQSLSVRLEVPPLFNGGFITGLAFSGGEDFLANNGTAMLTPARFLFVTLEGTVLGWAPRPFPLLQNTFAPIVQNNFDRGDRYTGLALARIAVGARLCIADFGRARVEVLDGTFEPVQAAFTDPNLPAGFSPFNVRVLGDRILIAYAVPNAQGDDFLPGAGSGIIDAFSLEGDFQSRLVTRGPLNAPWGMALAPADFGPFSNSLLVANAGDGRINAFNPSTGAFLGALADPAGNPIAIDGLRGIDFGNGLPGQATNTLYYAASPSFGVVGQFARIDAVCPSAPLCYANCDASTAAPLLNAGDFTCFLSRFRANDCYANCDGNTGVPALSAADFTCFLNKFRAGCP